MPSDSPPKPQGEDPRPQHIRPRVQRKKPRSPGVAQDKPPRDQKGGPPGEVEEARKRMESWMGLGGVSSSNTSCNTSGNTSSNTSSNHSYGNTVVVSTHEPTRVPPVEPKPEKKLPASILKTPKYSGATGSSAVVTGSPPAAPAPTGTGILQTVAVSPAVPSGGPQPEASAAALRTEPEAGKICRDVVVERDPAVAAKRRRSFRRGKKGPPLPPPTAGDAALRASAIEGYVPFAGKGAREAAPASEPLGASKSKSTSTTAEGVGGDSGGQEPLVIESLEALMRAAGEPMPENPDTITEDTKMVEANIAFSVMTKDQYEQKIPELREEHEEERRRQLEVFLGKRNIFQDDESAECVEGAVDGDARETGEEEDDDEDDDDADAMMELLLGSDMENSDDDDDRGPPPEPEVRAFSLLWNALVNWMTHETVEWVKALRETQGSGGNDNDTATTTNHSVDTEWTPMVDRSDVGASRCAGVMAMVRLYLGRCMEELSHPPGSKRRAEKRLNDLMRTFDYSRENPRLSPAHWRAMVCVLLEVVLGAGPGGAGGAVLPPSIAGVGMKREEFEYLSRKAVLAFG